MSLPILSGLAKYKGKTHILNTGQIMPAIGLGTSQDPDEQEGSLTSETPHEASLKELLRRDNYGTEKQVGQGIKRSGVEPFLTTKLWCNVHRPDDVEPALAKFLSDLDTVYVNLYLMHYPCAHKRGPDFLPFGPEGKMITDPTDFIDTWKVMEKLLTRGKTRAIGLSNFSKIELERILEEGSVIPAVHQTELHPYLQQKDFVKWHAEEGIWVIQFSPCGNLNTFYRKVSGAKDVAQMTRLIDHPILLEIATRHGKSPIQIALAWGVGNSRCVISKSTVEWQIRENIEADQMVLDENNLKNIETMDRKARFNDPSTGLGYMLYIGLDGAAT